jgi:hypothetical protein
MSGVKGRSGCITHLKQREARRRAGRMTGKKARAVLASDLGPALESFRAWRRRCSQRRRDDRRNGPEAERNGRADAHRRATRERMRAWRAANPELARNMSRERSRKWREENPDLAREKSRARYTANQARQRARALEYYYANHEQKKTRARERARLLASQGNLLSLAAAAASIVPE